MNRHDAHHPLFGCTLKLRRAHEHLEALDGLVQSFRRRDPHEIRTYFDAEAQECLVWTRIREEPLPEWSLIIGDIVHNLRSSLDHLAYQLVIKNQREPTDRTSFPIFHNDPFTNNPEGTRAWRDRVEGMHEDDVALIKSLQPYQRRYDPEAEPPEDDTLFTLNALWNADKHRELILTSIFYTGPEFGIERIGNYAVEVLEQRPSAPCEDRAIVARYKLTPLLPDTVILNAEVDVNLEGAFEIALIERSLPDPLKILPVLRIMSRRVSDVVDDFALRFGQANS